MKTKSIKTTFESSNGQFKSAVRTGAKTAQILNLGNSGQSTGYLNSTKLRELAEFALELADYIEQEGKDG